VMGALSNPQVVISTAATRRVIWRRHMLNIVALYPRMCPVIPVALMLDQALRRFL
jgi:hypothetical protein